MKELACIPDRLVAEDIDASIARVYANGDEQGDAFNANVKAMEAAMAACREQYNWSDDRTNLAAQVAMFQIVLDHFSRALSASKGVTAAAFDQIGTVLTRMPSSDRNRLMDGDWRDDRLLMKRVSDQLIAAGLPNDSTVMGFALLIMEAKLVITYSTMDWVEAAH